MASQGVETLSPAAGTRLERLRASFEASLPARVDRLLGAIGGTDSIQLPVVRDAAHQLAGTAPMFGLARIGAVAAEIEAMADAVIADVRDPTTSEQARIQNLIERVKSLIDETRNAT